MALDKNPFSVDACVKAVLGIFKQANDKEIELTCHIDPNVPPFIVGDIIRIRYIITQFSFTWNLSLFKIWADDTLGGTDRYCLIWLATQSSLLLHVVA